MKRCRLGNVEAGFTLLEVLIALAILAIVMVSAIKITAVKYSEFMVLGE